MNFRAKKLPAIIATPMKSPFRKICSSIRSILPYMKGTMADYVIASVSETMLIDVFPFDANSVPAEKKTDEELMAEAKKEAETK